MNLPKSFSDLVDNFTILPGVGEKTAESMYIPYMKKNMMK